MKHLKNRQKIFTVLYGNACCLINKVDELSALVIDQNPDFILISESWAHTGLNNAFFSVPGFEIVCREDRKDTSSGIGGGLLLYAKENIVGCVTEYRCEKMDEFNQCCAVKIRTGGGSECVLVLVYRPHHLYKETVIQTNQTKLNNQKLCQMLSEIPRPCFIIGDFNYSRINWEIMNSDSASEEFVTAVEDNFLSQHVSFPTLSSGTQPDLVLSSNPDMVIDVDAVCNLGASDHCMLKVSLAGSISNTTFEEVPDWRKADFEQMRKELLNSNLVEKLENIGALASWDVVKNALHDAQSKSVPTKRRRISSRPLWLKPNVLRTIRKKKRLWKTYQNSKEYEEYLAYKKVEREVKGLVLKAKRTFERKLAKEAKKKPKLFYSYLKSRTSTRQSVGPLKDGEELVTDSTCMANMLNKFFASVFTKETVEIPEPSTRNSDSTLEDIKFPIETIVSKIKALNPSSAFGPDRIGPRLLQATADILCVPLGLVFVRCMEEGLVPDDWRMANVTPIFKSGSKAKAGNYRPVSLTCIICKLMESIIRDAMILHLTSNNLIRASQHGFMASKSCQTNLIEYLNTLTKLVDEGHDIDVVYLDFAKAFDKVPHQRLLRKLEAKGISGKVLRWIEAWLTDRQQRVVLNGHVSDWIPVTSGVPQGSVLGPACFVVFIDDIDEVLDLVNGFVYKFADDTKYGRVIRSEEDQRAMQEDINQLMYWAERWQMEFNSVKCKIMHLGNSNPNFNYTMGGYAPAGTVLESVSQEKDIGVIVHETLKPAAQCHKASMKANQVLGQMAQSFHYRDKNIWIRLYKVFVRPHLEFAVQAWSPWYKSDVDTLEKVQKRAVNMVVGLKGRTYEEKLKEIGLMSLKQRRLRGDMIQIWKYIHGKCPMAHDMLGMSVDQHSRLTRHTGKPFNLARVKCNLEIRKNFFTVRCVDAWNHLPAKVQAEEDLAKFKIAYDKFVHEFMDH